MPFISTTPTVVQTFQYKIIHRTIACNEWLKNIKIKIDNTCSVCTNADSISHLLIDCISNRLLRRNWAKWWQAMTGFNIREENHIQESILLRFLRDNDDAIVINYYMLYGKHCIHL